MSLPSPPVQRPRLPRASQSPTSGRSSLADYAATTPGNVPGGGSSPGGMVPTADPFSDLSNLSIPDTPQETYEMCRNLVISSEVHKAYVRKMARLPATAPRVKMPEDITAPIQDPTRRRGFSPRRRVLERIRLMVDEALRLKKFNQETGINYFTNDAAVVTLRFPFVKMLTCTHCDQRLRADSTSWRLSRDATFYAVCTHCGKRGNFPAFDRYIRSEMDIRAEVLDMRYVYSQRSGHGRDLDIYYALPEHDVQRIRDPDADDRDFILAMSQPELEAALGVGGYEVSGYAMPMVRLRRDHYYVMYSPHVPQGSNGLPIPGFLATVKPYWMLRTLQRASEAVAAEHIIPLDVLFPDTRSTTGSIFEIMHVASVMNVMRQEMDIKRTDPGYLPMLPYPIMSHRVGGDGKNFLLSQEIRVYMEALCAALECPIEFIFGGLSYSGADVSIQQMVKRFDDYRDDLLDMNRWMMRRICAFMDWPPVVIEFKEFRLGQDLALMQFVASLASQDKLSWQRLYSMLDADTDAERAQIREDTIFALQLQQLRTNLEIKAQHEMMSRQGVAQAEATVQGRRKMFTESQQLAEDFRADPKMWDYIKNDPAAAQEIFGALAPEVVQTSSTANMHYVPQTPSPGVVAPTPLAAEQVQNSAEDPQELLRMVESLPGMMAGTQLDDDAPTQEDVAEVSEGFDLVGALLDEIAGMEVSQWPAALDYVRNAYGEPVAAEIFSILEQSQATLSQRSTYAPGVRDAFMQ